MKRVLLIELNEVNFDFIRRYTTLGRLPAFARLLAEHGVANTISEANYEHLEPWIQWVTAHSGKCFAEHGVFRLGDIVHHDIPQIWELLEDRGIRVGAISPMNAKLRAKAPAFFVPDPWTPTGIKANWLLRRLFAAIQQGVNDNAQGRLTAGSLFGLLIGVMRYARPTNYFAYARLAATSLKSAWRRAIILDLLLADVFVAEVKQTRAEFASLFLNAAAHIQHHYMFSSAAYRGKHRNPDWYLNTGEDPVLEIYTAYDRIISQISRAFPDARLMIATGLHQEPHEQMTYYWRLRNHEEFLRRIAVPFARVEPRMSRDFLVSFHDSAASAAGARILADATAPDGTKLFSVDNRGLDAFVMFTYPNDIPSEMSFSIDGTTYTGLRDDVAFVAIKNGEHHGTGYFVDTALSSANTPREFALTALPSRIIDAFFAAEPDAPRPFAG